jgi:hypothetical protein
MRPRIICLALALAGCATAPHELGPRSTLSSIDGAELRGARATNVEDALRQFRPEFLRNGQQPDARTMGVLLPSVYVDGVYTGTTDVLRMIPVGAVIAVRRLSASAAHDRFGAGCPCGGGVLLVTTRRE